MTVQKTAVAIRRERPQDYAAIRRINQAAFGRAGEAALVDRLREDGAVLASLIAEVAREPAGHILFSRMFIDTNNDGNNRSIAAVALAPMAVLPAFQRHGIGSELIREGLKMLAGERIVIVLGHREYYPRFGFSSERALPLANPFPSGALMAMELDPGALSGVAGRVRYAAAFGISVTAP